ncbi:hypothetical protein DPMN_009421 [Dreissena polymorpha]|uniref:Uncharacterized protein n=1 Tax=Dreissena polymorpha TaxID=45954 RepID=A0A9D4N022_DREPO|nr:hypothetical protein DPMN_009421 [Dreissena polymorpha]
MGLQDPVTTAPITLHSSLLLVGSAIGSCGHTIDWDYDVFVVVDEVNIDVDEDNDDDDDDGDDDDDDDDDDHIVQLLNATSVVHPSAESIERCDDCCDDDDDDDDDDNDDDDDDESIIMLYIVTTKRNLTSQMNRKIRIGTNTRK